MKKFLSLILVGLMAFAGYEAKAHMYTSELGCGPEYEHEWLRTSFSIDGINYFINPQREGTVCVIGDDDISMNPYCRVREDICYYSETEYGWHGNAYAGNVVIPSTVEYDGKVYTVNAILPGAFCHCHELLSVSIPDTVKFIGDGAFFDCPKLKSLKLDHLRALYVGWDIVGCCPALEFLSLPVYENNFKPDFGVSMLMRVDDGMFSVGELKSLKAIYNPNTDPEDWQFVVRLESLSEAEKGTLPVYVPKGTLEYYKAEKYYWGNYINLIEYDPAGVELEVTEETVAGKEFYDLQGRKVVRPASGLYIERAGDAVRKVLIK